MVINNENLKTTMSSSSSLSSDSISIAAAKKIEKLEKQLQRKELKQLKLQHELQLKNEKHKTEIRENVRIMFNRIFTNYFREEQQTEQKEEEKNNIAEKYAKDIEKHIFNYTINKCKYSGIRPIIWSNTIIQHVYKERSRDLLCNLNPNGYVKNKTLIKRLMDHKEFDLYFLVNHMLTGRDLMPERYFEYDEEKRIEQAGVL